MDTKVLTMIGIRALNELNLLEPQIDQLYAHERDTTMVTVSFDSSDPESELVELCLSRDQASVMINTYTDELEKKAREYTDLVRAQNAKEPRV